MTDIILSLGGYIKDIGSTVSSVILILSVIGWFFKPISNPIKSAFRTYIKGVAGYDEIIEKMNTAIETQENSVREAINRQNSMLEELCKNTRGMESTIKGLIECDIVILRDRIIQSCEYHIAKKYIAIYEKQSLQEMYNKYHSFGENGIIDNLWARLLLLPNESETTRVSKCNNPE